MEWPRNIRKCDVVIRVVETPAGTSFVVFRFGGVAHAYSTYAEAEAEAGSSAGRDKRACVWQLDANGLALVGEPVAVGGRSSGLRRQSTGASVREGWSERCRAPGPAPQAAPFDCGVLKRREGS